ncbi:protein of unknown function [Shewanella benthica]|uniref:Uncharacterized protein n=1 Tax=Shewanella benthica TaxID=43661 RepID=A0A330LY08_9GAMM|nr:protein of unknown function [Shewanella benthica]
MLIMTHIIRSLQSSYFVSCFRSHKRTSRARIASFSYGDFNFSFLPSFLLIFGDRFKKLESPYPLKRKAEGGYKCGKLPNVLLSILMLSS